MINPAIIIAVLLYVIGSDDRSVDYSQYVKTSDSLVHTTFKSIMHRYSRDVTVLEIGASIDSVYKKAVTYPKSVFVVLAEGDDSKVLPSNVIWLDREPSLEDIEKLSLSEHFDVVILHDNLHDDFERIVTLCKRMSHHLVIDTFTPFSIQTDTPFSLIKRSFVHPRTIQRSFTVYYDYADKYLIKVRPPYPDQKSTWQPGINLMTYLSLNGTYPDRERIASNLPVDLEHLDWMPNNMILQGNKIILVDRGDPANAVEVPGTTRLCRDELVRTMQLVMQSQHKTSDDVKKLFCKIYDVEGLLRVEESD